MSDGSYTVKTPQPGAIHLHANGLCVILGVFQSSDKGEDKPMVGYMDLETGKKFWKPLDEFKWKTTFCGYVEEFRIDKSGHHFITKKY